jgi:hypothetical protein
MRYPIHSASEDQWIRLAVSVALRRLEDHVVGAHSVDDAWCIIKSGIFDSLDSIIPKREIKPRDRKKPIWASYEAWRAIRRKRNAFTRFKRRNSRAAWEYYEGCTEECDRLCQMSIRRFELKLAQNIKSDVKSFFAYANRRQPPPVSCPVLQRFDGSYCDNPTECAELFSDFFASVFTPPGIAQPFAVQHDKVPLMDEPARFPREAVLQKLRTIDPKGRWT